VKQAAPTTVDFTKLGLGLTAASVRLPRRDDGVTSFTHTPSQQRDAPLGSGSRLFMESGAYLSEDQQQFNNLGIRDQYNWRH
jgi:hypothetical protein